MTEASDVGRCATGLGQALKRPIWIKLGVCLGGALFALIFYWVALSIWGSLGGAFFVDPSDDIAGLISRIFLFIMLTGLVLIPGFLLFMVWSGRNWAFGAFVFYSGFVIFCSQKAHLVHMFTELGLLVVAFALFLHPKSELWFEAHSK